VGSLRAGALYFVLVFAAGWVLGPIRQLLVVPRLGETAGILLEAPFMLLAMTVAARWTIKRLAIAPGLGTRAAVGLVALGLVLVAELAGARWLRGLSIGEYLAKFVSMFGGISALLFVIFALMPTLVARPRR
jgi:hypothetical protein